MREEVGSERASAEEGRASSSSSNGSSNRAAGGAAQRRRGEKKESCQSGWTKCDARAARRVDEDAPFRACKLEQREDAQRAAASVLKLGRTSVPATLAPAAPAPCPGCPSEPGGPSCCCCCGELLVPTLVRAPASTTSCRCSGACPAFLLRPCPFGNLLVHLMLLAERR